MQSTEPEYIRRITDTKFEQKLKTLGGLVVVGPKWCGKTTTSEQFAHSCLYLDDENDGTNYIQIAGLNPGVLLDGETPRLIDEWQLAPELFDAARRIIDKRRKSGQFIFTGSTTPPTLQTKHSGTGRFSKVEMHPMSLYESGESNGSISLAALFDNRAVLDTPSELTIERLAFAIVRGGWPGALRLPEDVACNIASEYIESLINSDFLRLQSPKGQTKRDPAKLRALLRSYARNTSTMASLETILNDVNSSGIKMSRSTAENYLRDLKHLYAIYDQPAWNGKLRSRTPIRQAPKRHMADPSLAAAALGATQERLLLDYATFGFLFESLCVRELTVYVSPLNGSVTHYRDKSNLECDIILSLDDGRWAGIEVKLGSKQEDEAAANLLALSKKIDTDTCGQPAFLAILTGGKFPYCREDGIYVIPIGCLGP
jgi:predicted AAA+ superfamily ATPase